MDSNAFMGMLIAAIVVLAGLAVALVTLVIKPVVNLNTNITKLTNSVDTLNSVTQKLDARVTDHDKALDAHSIKLAEHEKDIKHLQGGK